MRARIAAGWSLGCALLLVASLAFAREPYLLLTDCRQVQNESNDADSFHVKAAGKTYIFRLYFVDAPETEASFPDRIAEQANYFGLTTDQTLELGEMARQFTKEKLGPSFTVRTRMHEAMGRSKKPRYYAFVETKQGDLAELLVANGLARLHGSSAKPESLASPEREWIKLERLERESKQQKVGAWGAPFGRMTARLPSAPPKTAFNSFDAFFHPERVAAPDEAVSLASSPPAVVDSASSSPPAPGALDPNTATSADLLGIPGVGPVLASRIIAARPFSNADALRKVKGIGEKKYSQIRPFFAPAPPGDNAR